MRNRGDNNTKLLAVASLRAMADRVERLDADLAAQARRIADRLEPGRPDNETLIARRVARRDAAKRPPFVKAYFTVSKTLPNQEASA